jgi:hypothetical protein
MSVAADALAHAPLASASGGTAVTSCEVGRQSRLELSTRPSYSLPRWQWSRRVASRHITLLGAMLFNSLVFVGFFVVVYGGYLALQGKLRVQNLWLLAGSWLFYGYWDRRFLGLLILSSSIDFFTAIQLRHARSPRHKKWWLLASLVSNLSILGFFKYFGFFAESLVGLLDMLGISADAPILQLLHLPGDRLRDRRLSRRTRTRS